MALSDFLQRFDNFFLPVKMHFHYRTYIFYVVCSYKGYLDEEKILFYGHKDKEFLEMSSSCNGFHHTVNSNYAIFQNDTTIEVVMFSH